MPPRKSDQGAAATAAAQPARKSDVSTARFVLAPDAGTPIAAAGKPALPSLAASADTIPASPSATAPAEAAPAVGDASFVSTANSTSGGGEKKKKDDGDRELAIEDLNLPKSIITRLAKGVLPPNTQIQANAILAMTKSASVFVSHLANAANEITTASNKRTVMPQDVFSALDDIEFGFMRPQLEAEFAKFNQIQTAKRSSYRKKVAAAKKGPDDADGDTTLADASALSADATGIQADVSSHGETSSGGLLPPRSGPDHGSARKKARTEGGGGGGAGAAAGGLGLAGVAAEEVHSDAETEPDDVDAETEPEEEEEEEEEEEDDEDDADRRPGDDEERDALEEREERFDEDEALDGNDSD